METRKAIYLFYLYEALQTFIFRIIWSYYFSEGLHYITSCIVQLVRLAVVRRSFLWHSGLSDSYLSWAASLSNQQNSILTAISVWNILKPKGVPADDLTNP